MNEDRTVAPDAGDEPATTLKNSATILEEDDLARETSTRTADGVIPAGYGSSGGYIPPDDERPADDTA